MNENRFQASLIRKLKEMLPGAIVLKQDANYRQGIPDLLVMCGGKWAALECKKDAGASHQPNQDWYVKQMNSMSFARFIFPENEKEVLDELLGFLGPQGQARLPEPERIPLAE